MVNTVKAKAKGLKKPCCDDCADKAKTKAKSKTAKSRKKA